MKRSAFAGRVLRYLGDCLRNTWKGCSRRKLPRSDMPLPEHSSRQAVERNFLSRQVSVDLHHAHVALQKQMKSLVRKVNVVFSHPTMEPYKKQVPHKDGFSFKFQEQFPAVKYYANEYRLTKRLEFARRTGLSIPCGPTFQRTSVDDLSISSISCKQIRRFTCHIRV